MTLNEAIRLTTALVGCAVVLSSAELLVEFGRLEDRDLLGWDVGRYYSKWSMKGWLGKCADLLFAPRAFRIVVALRLASGIALVFQAARGPVDAWLIGCAFIGTFLIAIRSVFGLDGAYQMNLVTLAGLWVNAVSPVGSIAAWAGIMFIAAQLGLSYAIAGLTKLLSVAWRKGEAITGILGTTIYGDARIFAVVAKRPRLALVSAWSVIAFETSFVPMCLLGGKAALLAMLLGVGFHISNAVFMGLNGFLVSFVAVYPIVWTLFGQ